MPVVAPETEIIQSQQRAPLYHVILLNDDEHTYDYVIEMLCKLFFMAVEQAFQHAVEVDNVGRTVVITCELPEAEFARDQIHGYGRDPRMEVSKGSMSAVIQRVPGSLG